MPAYSTTPLAKKLGVKPGFQVWLINAPNHYLDLFNDWPDGTHIIDGNPAVESVDFIHLFCYHMEELVQHAAQGKAALKKNGLLWVSWPKGTAKIPTDLKREPIREYLLDVGLVDVKVASVDDTWSGLKFVYRVKDR